VYVIQSYHGRQLVHRQVDMMQQLLNVCQAVCWLLVSCLRCGTSTSTADTWGDMRLPRIHIRQKLATVRHIAIVC